MVRNYFVVAVRNLLKHKVYSVINILGLAIGMACCILIFLFVQDEFRYDAFHTNAHRIFRVLRESKTAGSNAHFDAGTSGGITPAMLNDFPEVEAATRLMGWGMWVRYDDKLFDMTFRLVDADILKMFDLKLTSGDPEAVLAEPGSVIVSERAAKWFFGNEDPVGKVITVDDDKLGGDYKITGVVKNMPKYAHIHFDFLTPEPPSDSPEYFRDRAWQGWSPNISWRPFQNYIMLREGYSRKELEGKLHEFMVRYMGKEVAAKNAYHLQPLNRIHLYSSEDFGFQSGGSIAYIYQLSLIGFFILLIACINFMNLATARSAKRAREVGLRKVVGAGRPQVLWQFLGESLLLALMALVLAVGITLLALPEFNNFMAKDLTLGVDNTVLLAALLAIVLFVGLLAGSYPAFFLSAFQPVAVLKGTVVVGSANTYLRKGLVVFQFAASIALIISTIVVFRQTEYMKHRDLGYDKTLLLNVSIFFPDLSLKPRKEAVKQAFLRHPNVLQGTVCWPPPGGYVEYHGVRPEGVDRGEWEMQAIGIDEDFFDTYGIELVMGRNLDLRIASDKTEAFILNETAVKMLGWEDPVGKQFEWRDRRKGRVIGVVKDFHTQSLHHEVEPVVMLYWTHLILSLRIHSEGVPETMAFIEKTWKEFIPHLPPDFYFVDDEIEASYRAEEHLNQSCGIFALLAIFVACLGLFGLASFMAEQRTKEIGIRKALGASITHIMTLLSKDFLTPVLIANLIAWPLVYWAIGLWLNAFPYRIDLGMGSFLLGALMALMIALLTVGYQARRAAHTNPVDALRYE